MSSAGFLVALPALFVMKEIDFNNPTNLMILRSCYGLVQGLLLSMIIFLLTKIRASADQTKLEVPLEAKFGEPPIEGPPQFEYTTVEEYDISQLRGLVGKAIMGVVITGLIHWKWGLTPPLFMQCFINPIQFFGAPLVQVHLRGKEARGSLARPWKEEKPFEKWANLADPNREQRGEKKKLKEAKEAKKKLKK